MPDALNHYFETTLQATRYSYNKRIESRVKALEKTTQTRIMWDKFLEHHELSVELKLKNADDLAVFSKKLIENKTSFDKLLDLI